jgi:hypothetical protein
VLFTIAGMATVVGRHNRSPLRVLTTLGMGAIMLAVLATPDFSHFAAACLTAVLALPLLVAAVGSRVGTRQAPDHPRRTALAVSVVDIVFMSVAVLVMPTHGTVRQSGFPSLMSGIHGASMAMAGGMAVGIVLLTWASCAAVLVVPGLVRHPPDGLVHIVCSGCMIAAMGAMVA